MAEANEVLWHIEGDPNRLMFWCPGCKCMHSYDVMRWQWNQSLTLPSFTPSLLCTWTEGEAETPKRCHLYITDGKINFCGDCTHELNGKQGVPMTTRAEFEAL